MKFSSGKEKTNCRRMLKLIIIFQNLFLFFFFVRLFTSNRTDIHWHMQSEHFVVLFITIQTPNQQRLDIYLFIFLYSKHENTLKYLQKKYTYNAHHSNIVIIWDWFESVKRKYCVWQSLLFKVIKSTAREKEAQKKKNHLKTIQNRKSDNGNPKRIWL